MAFGGDRLARGARTADFSVQTDISQFEFDVMQMDRAEVAIKYGLSESQLDIYEAERLGGTRLPDLKTVEVQKEEADKKLFTVSDRRPIFDDKLETPEFEAPEKEYSLFRPIMDRILVKRVGLDKNTRVLSDGSLLDKRTGFVTPGSYRQHSNVGIVLAAGQFVAIGGIREPMENIVKPGYRVTFGDYNSEKFILTPEKEKALCEAVGIPYLPEDESIRIVRVQDVRGIEVPVE